MLRENITGLAANADEVGRALAAKLVARGADKILAALDGHK
jgi:hydroxymethylbilane synthase